MSDYTPEQALEELDAEWGDRFDIAFSGAQFVARRIDNTGQTLTAAAAQDLHEAIRADYATVAEQLDQAVADAYRDRGIKITCAGSWHALVREPAAGGQTVVTRVTRAALMARLRELDIAGILPD